ncbi:unnamed protein product [Protopolystoma xenopodis]|uniref:Uncharacterized protein n=1 Tax=Protopolystoma xenopodis TaxID=117903 RepID=A0A3S5AUW8_9PLAT|nr:unnamed protein product [Protopolystoma xenopodis]
MLRVPTDFDSGQLESRRLSSGRAKALVGSAESSDSQAVRRPGRRGKSMSISYDLSFKGQKSTELNELKPWVGGDSEAHLLNNCPQRAGKEVSDESSCGTVASGETAGSEEKVTLSKMDLPAVHEEEDSPNNENEEEDELEEDDVLKDLPHLSSEERSEFYGISFDPRSSIVHILPTWLSELRDAELKVCFTG